VYFILKTDSQGCLCGKDICFDFLFSFTLRYKTLIFRLPAQLLTRTFISASFVKQVRQAALFVAQGNENLTKICNDVLIHANHPLAHLFFV